MLTRDYLTEGLNRTCEEICTEVSRMPLKYWNESVFRFYLIRHLRCIDASRVWDVEWNRIDIVVLGDAGGKVPVELKFWCYRGPNEQYRGGPSSQNYREFKKDIEKLRDHQRLRGEIISEAYLVLLYADPVNTTGSTFGSYYDEFPVNPSIRASHLIKTREFSDSDCKLKMTCKLVEIELP